MTAAAVPEELSATMISSGKSVKLSSQPGMDLGGPPDGRIDIFN